jgi:hypothetical protein
MAYNETVSGDNLIAFKERDQLCPVLVGLWAQGRQVLACARLKPSVRLSVDTSRIGSLALVRLRAEGHVVADAVHMAGDRRLGGQATPYARAMHCTMYLRWGVDRCRNPWRKAHLSFPRLVPHRLNWHVFVSCGERPCAVCRQCRWRGRAWLLDQEHQYRQLRGDDLQFAPHPRYRSCELGALVGRNDRRCASRIHQCRWPPTELRAARAAGCIGLYELPCPL